MSEGETNLFFRELETERLLLKNIGYDDADFMYKEFSTEEVNLFLYDAEPISSQEEAKEWIDFYTQAEPREQHRWIIILRDTNEKIGTCGFHCWNRETGTVEIGYDLQPAYWQNGYISEAIKAIMDFAEKEMKVSAITAHIAEKNIASIKTVLKFGFVKTDKTYYEEFHDEKYLHIIYRKSV